MTRMRTRTAMTMMIFIRMFCHHILLRSCLPVLWNLSACKDATTSAVTHDASGPPKSLLVRGRYQLQPRHTTVSKHALAWKRRLSVLSTSSSIFSPRSSTFSMLSTMMFFTSLTCASRQHCSRQHARHHGCHQGVLRTPADTAACEAKWLQAAACAGEQNTHTFFCTAATLVSSSGCDWQYSM